MSLKAELETWSSALKAYDAEDFEKSLDLFSRIADSSKILTNMGLIYATLGEHEAAVEKFIEATSLDNYLAVAYFQCGVSNFLLGRYDLAYKDFEEALLYLRGNQAINYEQLGLKFRLFSAEVLFNKGLAQIYMNRVDEGIADMKEASKDKATEEHNVIDDAIRDRGEGYTVFSIPVGVLYRPSEKKLKNTPTKDYMGKAKLIAAADSADAFTTFTGVTRLKAGISPAGVYIERPEDSGARSQATPPTSATLPKPVGDDKPGLARSKTTLNVPANAREIINPPARSPSSAEPPRSAGVQRGPSIGQPVRGLSVRRNSPTEAAPPPPVVKDTNRMTDFYDDYLDSYGDAPPPPVPTNNNARSGSRSAPTSSYAPSSYGGGGSMRRRPTRRTTARANSRIQSTYEEEEEGYASGDYEDGPFELVKIRVKLHYQSDTRGMALDPAMPFEDFMDKITAKFNKPVNGLLLKFKDEDGGQVSLRDESDYDLAIETARESAKGKPEGKLEIWCVDV